MISLALNSKCLSLFEANDPTGCWIAPNYGLKDAEECKSDCESESSSERCCLVDCLARIGFVVEKPKKEKFMKIFEDFNFNEKETKEKELWMPVISKSYDYCERLCEIA